MYSASMEYNGDIRIENYSKLRPLSHPEELRARFRKGGKRISNESRPTRNGHTKNAAFISVNRQPGVQCYRTGHRKYKSRISQMFSFPQVLRLSI